MNPMDNVVPLTVNFSFPALVDFVGIVREYCSSLLEAHHFSSGFAYRTELVVDELWRNAVAHGALTPSARIEINLTLEINQCVITVINDGGSQAGLKELQQKIVHKQQQGEETLGLSIIQVLTNSIEAQLLDDNRLAVTITRKVLV